MVINLTSLFTNLQRQNQLGPRQAFADVGRGLERAVSSLVESARLQAELDRRERERGEDRGFQTSERLARQQFQSDLEGDRVKRAQEKAERDRKLQVDLAVLSDIEGQSERIVTRLNALTREGLGGGAEAVSLRKALDQLNQNRDALRSRLLGKQAAPAQAEPPPQPSPDELREAAEGAVSDMFRRSGVPDPAAPAQGSSPTAPPKFPAVGRIEDVEIPPEKRSRARDPATREASDNLLRTVTRSIEERGRPGVPVAARALQRVIEDPPVLRDDGTLVNPSEDEVERFYQMVALDLRQALQENPGMSTRALINRTLKNVGDILTDVDKTIAAFPDFRQGQRFAGPSPVTLTQAGKAKLARRLRDRPGLQFGAIREFVISLSGHMKGTAGAAGQ